LLQDSFDESSFEITRYINGKFINVSTVSDATVEIETVADLVEKLVKENAFEITRYWPSLIHLSLCYIFPLMLGI